MTHLRKCVSFSLILISLMGFVMLAPVMVGVARGEDVLAITADPTVAAADIIPNEEIVMMMEVYTADNIGTAVPYTLKSGGEILLVEDTTLSPIGVKLRHKNPAGVITEQLLAADGIWNEPPAEFVAEPRQRAWFKAAEVIRRHAGTQIYMHVLMKIRYFGTGPLSMIQEAVEIIYEPPKKIKEIEELGHILQAFRQGDTLLTCDGMDLVIRDIDPIGKKAVVADRAGLEETLYLGQGKDIQGVGRHVRLDGIKITSGVVDCLKECYLSTGRPTEQLSPPTQMNGAARIALVLAGAKKELYLGGMVGVLVREFEITGNTLREVIQELRLRREIATAVTAPPGVQFILGESAEWELRAGRTAWGRFVATSKGFGGHEIRHELPVLLAGDPPRSELELPLGARARHKQGFAVVEVAATDPIHSTAQFIIRDAVDNNNILKDVTLARGEEYRHFDPAKSEVLILELADIVAEDTVNGIPAKANIRANGLKLEPETYRAEDVVEGDLYRGLTHTVRIGQIDIPSKSMGFEIIDLINGMVLDSGRLGTGKIHASDTPLGFVIIELCGVDPGINFYTKNPEMRAVLRLNVDMTLERKAMVLELTGSQTLKKGLETNMIMVIRDHKGKGMDVSRNEISYATSDPGIATVDPMGKVKGLKRGTVAITARYRELTGTARLTILP